jgi:hypothetical protein
MCKYPIPTFVRKCDQCSKIFESSEKRDCVVLCSDCDGVECQGDCGQDHCQKCCPHDDEEYGQCIYCGFNLREARADTPDPSEDR